MIRLQLHRTGIPRPELAVGEAAVVATPVEANADESCAACPGQAEPAPGEVGGGHLEAEREEETFYHQKAAPEWLEALAPLGTDERKPL